jgi:hypothetical protein
MTSGPVHCPGCGEANTTDMAFCIFCGAALKSSQVATLPTGAIPLDQGRPSAVVPRARTCVNCGQTDSLNSQFCIFCGARVEGPSAAASGSQMAAHPGGDSRPAEQRGSRSRVWGLVACILAGGIGAGLGFGTSWWYHQKDAPPETARELPSKGLVILTAEPYSYFQVISEGRRYVTGKTGKDGDIALEQLEPNQYKVFVRSPEGKRWQGQVTVKAGEACVIGDKPELFAR